ncbi:MAG: tetratricopeptide repeat protein [Phycisphaerales bacterium]
MSSASDPAPDFDPDSGQDAGPDPGPDPGQVMDIFAAVIGCPESEQADVLHRRCDGDARVRDAVVRMLRADAQPPSWLHDDAIARAAVDRARSAAVTESESPATRLSADAGPGGGGGADATGEANPGPAASAAAAASRAVAAAARLPERIGPFRIVRLLGEGGMGTVFEAEQDHPQRTVALKRLRSGAGSPELARRFEIEIRSLARLRHPGIAQLLQVGVEDGAGGSHPWIAMEFVPGARSITGYADDEQLGASERLRLMAAVADAVHHGHQRGVIHRDLKPDNVLVDEQGAVKIIDFGVARGVDPEATAGATLTGQWVGTPRYMSPEQCLGKVRDVDMRTDTWAIGVLAYELLTGTTPHGTHESVVALGRAIAEVPPIPPHRHDRSLRGDVEAVLLRSLEKRADDRYQTAAEMADEFRRLVRGEAVAALRHSRWYVARRWAARRRKRLAAAAIALGLVAAVAIVAVIGERNRKLGENRQLQLWLLQAARPISDPFVAMPVDADRVATFEAAVESNANAKDASPADRLGEADMRLLLTRSWIDLGQPERAAGHAERCLALREEHDADPRALAEAHHALGRVRYWQRRMDDAEVAYRAAVELRRRHHGPRSAELADSLNDLAATLSRSGAYTEAVGHYRESLEIREATLGPDSPWTAATRNNFAILLADLGRLDEAADLLGSAADTIERRRDTESDPETRTRLERYALRARLHLASCRIGQGNVAAAGAILDEVETRSTQFSADDRRRIRASLVRTAWCLASEDWDGAAALASDVRDRLAASEARPAAAISEAELLLARAEIGRGRPETAVPIAQTALAELVAVHSSDHPDVADAHLVLAAGYLARQEPERAIEHLALAENMLRTPLDEAHPLRERARKLRIACTSRSSPSVP